MSEVDWWDGWGQNKRMFDRSWSGLVLWCCSHWGDLETGPLENYSRAFISQANKGNPSWPKCLAEKRGAVVTHLEALETCALFLSLIQNCLWMSFSVQISIYCPSTTQLGSHSPICGITDSMCTPGLWSQWEDNSRRHPLFWPEAYGLHRLDVHRHAEERIPQNDVTHLFYYHTMHHWRN